MSVLLLGDLGTPELIIIAVVAVIVLGGALLAVVLGGVLGLGVRSALSGSRRSEPDRASERAADPQLPTSEPGPDHER